MEIIEEVSEFFEELYETFISNPIKILSLSFVIFLALPIIKWFLSTVIYIIKPTAENLNNFTITTFVDNIIPWYLGIFIKPLKLLVFFLIIFLVTLLSIPIRYNLR